MPDKRSLDELKDLGAAKSAPEGVAHMYHQAFAEFGTRALWNWRELDPPTITQVLAIADSLRAEGDRAARALAVKIEQACRAALSSSRRNFAHAGRVSQPGELRCRLDALASRRTSLFR